VRAAGTAVAAVEGSTSLTYDELDRRSNQLARFMLRQGAGPGSLVGLHAGRSLASLLAIVATLKIRAGYVPLDPTTPYAYLDSIVRDCRADLVFSATRDGGVFAAPTINLSDALTLARAESNLALEEDAQPDDIADHDIARTRQPASRSGRAQLCPYQHDRHTAQQASHGAAAELLGRDRAGRPRRSVG